MADDLYIYIKEKEGNKRK